jgi:hypothetical protein
VYIVDPKLTVNWQELDEFLVVPDKEVKEMGNTAVPSVKGLRQRKDEKSTHKQVEARATRQTQY